ncbi:MAG: hypothetical protein S4CHLAM20_00300 [Chlamydiia bacterium]|nr:hypothetical protein [Chlamydiia bacterium]
MQAVRDYIEERQVQVQGLPINDVRATVQENTFFQNLYVVENAVGSFLTIPLRGYNDYFFFKELKARVDGNRYLADFIRASKVILDLIVTPFLGFLAGIGIIVNAIEMKVVNTRASEWAGEQFTNLQNGQDVVAIRVFKRAIDQQARSHEFRVLNTGPEDASLVNQRIEQSRERVEEFIDDYTKQGRLISRISIESDNTEMTGSQTFGLQLHVFSKVLESEDMKRVGRLELLI